jgi:hypothetical protein
VPDLKQNTLQRNLKGIFVLNQLFIALFMFTYLSLDNVIKFT